MPERTYNVKSRKDSDLDACIDWSRPETFRNKKHKKKNFGLLNRKIELVEEIEEPSEDALDRLVVKREGYEFGPAVKKRKKKKEPWFTDYRCNILIALINIMFGFIIIAVLLSNPGPPTWRVWVAVFWACAMIIGSFSSLIFFMTCWMKFEIFKEGVKDFAAQKGEHDPDFLHKISQNYNYTPPRDENIYTNYADLGLTEDEIKAFTVSGEFNMDAYEKYLEATLNESDSLSPEESPEEQEGDDELIVDDEEEEFNARKERKKREPETSRLEKEEEVISAKDRQRRRSPEISRYSDRMAGGTTDEIELALMGQLPSDQAEEEFMNHIPDAFMLDFSDQSMSEQEDEMLDIYEELFKLLGFRFKKFREAIEERIGDSINLFTLEEDDISDIIMQKGMRKRFLKTLEKIEGIYSEIFEENVENSTEIYSPEYEEALDRLIQKLDTNNDNQLNKKELLDMYPGLDESGISMVLLMADENADNQLNKEELRNHLPDLESIQDVLNIIEQSKVYTISFSIAGSYDNEEESNTEKKRFLQ